MGGAKNSADKSLLRPRQIAADLRQVNLAELENIGIKGLIIDLDNTICHWRQCEVVPEADALLQDALSRALQVCLLSNSSADRTQQVAAIYGISYIAPAYKPSSKAFKHAAAQMNLAPAQVAVLGDQLFTDVLGGNRAGCYTILVPPLTRREFIWTKFMRMLEKRVFASWK